MRTAFVGFISMSVNTKLKKSTTTNNIFKFLVIWPIQFFELLNVFDNDLRWPINFPILSIYVKGPQGLMGPVGRPGLDGIPGQDGMKGNNKWF